MKETSPQHTYIPRYDQLRSAASSPTDLRWGNFWNCGKERQRCLHGVETREHTTSPSHSEFNPHSDSFWGMSAPALTLHPSSLVQAGVSPSTWRTSAAHRLHHTCCAQEPLKTGDKLHFSRVNTENGLGWKRPLGKRPQRSSCSRTPSSRLCCSEFHILEHFQGSHADKLGNGLIPSELGL